MSVALPETAAAKPAPSPETSAEKGREIVALFEQYVVPSYGRTIPVVSGSGIELVGADGKRYLDFTGGVAVNSLGHAHPAIVETLKEQAATLVHCSNLFYSEPQGLLAQRLVELTGPGKIFFCNSGAEANDTLYKLARRVGHEHGKYEIITALNSFHGRTLGGIAATGQDKVKQGFGPLPAGFVHVPFNDLEAVRGAINEHTAAVLIEGVQGEGGIYPATPEYLLGLRALCDEHGLLLLVDAVQCGMFRTGAFQSWQRILEDTPEGETFAPDAIAMAKSLGSGYPIGAVWIAKKHENALGPGSHGSTYGGSPLACSVALTVLDVIAEERLAQNARRQGEHLLALLEIQRAARPGVIAEVRGMGLMIGVEFTGDNAPVLAAAREEGLLLCASGKHTVRFLPPLNVTDNECVRAIELFARALDRL